MAADYTGNTSYTHNQVGEKVSPSDRLEAKGLAVKSVQLCV
jgi:hypothetical protein